MFPFWWNMCSYLSRIQTIGIRKIGPYLEYRFGVMSHINTISFRAQNLPGPLVRDDQQSVKDKFSFTELVLQDE